MAHQSTSELIWNPKVASRTLEGEATILLNGRMLTLNEVGTFIWEAFCRGSTISGVQHKLEETYEVDDAQAARDTREFVEQLRQRGLLVAMRQEGVGE